MKYLFLEDLDYALQFWELLNLELEVRKKVISKRKSPNLLKEYGAEKLPGSELNSYGMLTRPIPNYRLLRKYIVNDEVYDPEIFLPNIPLVYETKSKIELIRSGFIDPIGRLPLFLDGWLNTRKVFLLAQPGIIKLINPVNENYLGRLPYESFVIRFNETFFLKREGFPEIPFSTILVNSDKENIDFLVIPYQLKELLPDSNLIERFKKIITKGKKIHLNDALKMSESLAGVILFDGLSMNKNSFEMHFFEEGLRKSEKLFNFNIEMRTTENADGNLVFEYSEIFFLINGFSKAISEVKNNSKSENIISEIKINEEQNENISFDWLKLPINQVYQLDYEAGELNLVSQNFNLLSTIGTEKSPHVRRGHWRTYHTKEGDVKKIWINQSIIREDKLEEEHLLGSAAVVKSE